MSITDKLTPPPPVDETGAPGTVMTQDQTKVIDIITSALKDHGIVLSPDQLVMKPAPVPAAPTPKVALTKREETLLGRCRTFIVGALKSHGISLSPQETQWIGAAVADFVQSEIAAPAAMAKDAPAASLAEAATTVDTGTVRKIG